MDKTSLSVKYIATDQGISKVGGRFVSWSDLAEALTFPEVAAIAAIIREGLIEALKEKKVEGRADLLAQILKH